MYPSQQPIQKPYQNTYFDDSSDSEDEEPDYECPFCDNTYFHQSSLKRHLKEAHQKYVDLIFLFCIFNNNLYFLVINNLKEKKVKNTLKDAYVNVPSIKRKSFVKYVTTRMLHLLL